MQRKRPRKFDLRDRAECGWPPIKKCGLMREERDDDPADGLLSPLDRSNQGACARHRLAKRRIGPRGDAQRAGPTAVGQRSARPNFFVILGLDPEVDMKADEDLNDAMEAAMSMLQ